MLLNLKPILYMFLIVSVIGYIFVVVKEKIHLKNNTIIIDKKAVTQEYLDEADIKIFALGGKQVKSGDEVKVVLHGNIKVAGIVIGAKKKEDSILLVTHKDKIKRLKVKKIKKFKVINRYGKFFR
ncbi:hypothetical protein [Sporosalibacterium faouarense]|uniref:hypothetical protein n=1 Tax=Sporosalibacterium faouarense TaxID=516123 RepID=UPI00141C782C|nr:hypothetical protein [Sporosalibacterium faouarense]MTI47760.1 hypothetical protein [Bacillota bacterium]